MCSNAYKKYSELPVMQGFPVDLISTLIQTNLFPE